MPTLNRPDVDVLDGLTTAIVVGQERMGGDVRSTVGTATDTGAMLRILFSRLGEPHIGGPQAFSFNVASISGAGAVTLEKGGREIKERREFSITGGMCPRCEGRGHGVGLRPHRALRRLQVDRRGRDHDPRHEHGRLVRPDPARLRLLPGGQADRAVHEAGAGRPALQGADEAQDRGHQPHLHRADPADPEVVPVQGPGGDAALRPRVRGPGGRLRGVPRVRRHPPVRGRAVVEDRGRPHRRGQRVADQRRGRVDPRARRPVGGAAPVVAVGDPGLVRRDRARLPLPRPPGGHAVRRRGAAHQDDPAPRVGAHRRHLRLRRAHHRAAPARHRPDEHAPAAPARQGQHRARRRAQAGDDRDRRPGRRPRPGRRHRRRRGRLPGQPRRAAGQRHPDRPAPRRPRHAQDVGAHAGRRDGGARRGLPQPAQGRRRHPAGRARRPSPGWPARARPR